MNKTYNSQVLIIGGGLSAMLAALRLAQNNVDVLLIDNSLPEANGRLGGFAGFSGAKFSMPPAGMGLLPLVGSSEALNEKIREVLIELTLSAHSDELTRNQQTPGETQLGHNTELRSYQSIVLSPNEISNLLEKLASKIYAKCRVLKADCRDLSPTTNGWKTKAIECGNGSEVCVRSNVVFYAGGRLSSDILINAGVQPLSGKGLDIGVRIEALDLSAVAGLRSLGPDAKIIRGDCRTFCLNSPGLIYRYPHKNFTIPGGIVANKSVKHANVGLLCRVTDKQSRLSQINNAASKMSQQLIEDSSIILSGSAFGQMEKSLSNYFGNEVTEQLLDFCDVLSQLNLINWQSPHKLHLPLLDWHWHTFAKPGSHKTSVNGIYALGDSAGHARGLLQAAVSGWIAAEEYMR